MPRLRLTLILSGRAFQELSFERFGTLTIGRNEGCEVRLDNLAVSRLHAELRDEGGAVVLHDLRSATGVRVNGVKVQRHALDDGDLIAVGKFTIAVQLEGASGVAPPAGATGERTLAAPTAAAAAARAAVALHAYLRDPAGTDTPLEKAVYLFGRGPEHDFEAAAPGLLHRFDPPLAAALLRDDATWRVVDATPGGTAVFVDGEPVQDARLRHDQTLRVHELRLVFRLGRAESP